MAPKDGKRKAAPDDAPRRSGRAGPAHDGPKRWDERQRQRHIVARLNFLERDNHQQDNTHMMKVQRVEEDEMVGSSDPKKKRKKASLAEKTRNRALDTILFEGQAEQRTQYGVAHSDIAAPPPKGGTVRKLCSVCGFKAPYSCTITGMPYCSRPCYALHEETRLAGQK
mmetsp:Transcript_2841/g.6759  ORF Transcript_2841/g.6759 Transcript_2841/m.6759 type:complete len:168 (-) Transcript_2841:51-554(-)